MITTFNVVVNYPFSHWEAFVVMLFISSDLYVDAIQLALNDDDLGTKELLRTILKIYEQDSKTNPSIRTHTTKFCVVLLEDILRNDIKFEDREDLLPYLLKFKNNANLNKEENTYLILERMINRERRLPKPKIDELRQKMSNSLLFYEVFKIEKEMMELTQKCSMQEKVETQNEFFDNILSKAKELVEAFEGNKFLQSTDELNIEKIDFSNKESIMRGIKSYKKFKTKGMPTGLKKLNKLFGRSGGPTRGESICINALMHNFKTGLLLHFARWLVKYNSPSTTSDKKPLILFISLENEANMNLMELYKNAYEVLARESAIGKTDEEICDYVYEYFNDRGFTLIVERKIPEAFGYDEFVRTIEDYERQGYEIYGVLVDYMNNMKKFNSKVNRGDRPDLLLRALYSLMCNYTKNKNITLITAHQLNRGAADIANSGVIYPVKKFGANHLSDGMDPQREVDLVLFVHIEKNPLNGKTYLTVSWGKHRYVHDTPETHKFVCFELDQFGLKDDLNTNDDWGIRDIYAETKKKDRASSEEDLY